MQQRIASPVTLELMKLVEGGHVDQALQILDSLVNTTVRDFLEPWGSFRVTLAQLAAWSGSLPILKRLETLGANLDLPDKLGRCALHHAVHQGHSDVVKWLLEHGVAIENRVSVSFVPRNEPCDAGGRSTDSNYKIGENLPFPECWGRTALHQAVKSGHVDIVKILVDAGANVNARDERGFTPLHLAVMNVNPDDPREISLLEKVADILVSASASVDIVLPDTGETALHLAVKLDNRKTTRILLNGGARAEAQCETTGITPLHIAASAGSYETLNILLTKLDSALINAQDKFGRTPLHAAAYGGHLKCIRALVDQGGSLASMTEDGDTVADAIFAEVVRPVAFLTDILDARVRAEDNEGKQQVTLDFNVLAPRGEPQMAVILALIGAVPFMKQMTILQHPLVEAFLGLKWSRLRRFFFILVIVHVFFVLSLSGYAIVLLRGTAMSSPRRLLLFCALILLSHNILQLIIAPRVYARQFETWLSIIGVTLSIIVAVVGEFGADVSGPLPPSWVLQSISIAILFAWIQMMLLVGRFPTWGHYALMFSTVLKNVAKVLVASVWLIIGFSLSFSVLFHQNELFNNTWKAFVKTVIMMMGEYDYSNLFDPAEKHDLTNDHGRLDHRGNYNNSANSSDTDGAPFLPFIGRLVFLIFVMLVSIVLMNLMIGLAVSDIQGLLDEGHMRRLLKQAAFVAHLESVTSHRIFRNRLVHRFFKSMLKARNTIPTRITLGMFTGYEKGVHGISEELTKVLFELALRNRNLDKECKRSVHCEKNIDTIAETISSLRDEVEELKRNEIGPRWMRMKSTRNFNSKRRKSVGS